MKGAMCHTNSFNCCDSLLYMPTASCKCLLLAFACFGERIVVNYSYRIYSLLFCGFVYVIFAVLIILKTYPMFSIVAIYT